MQFMPDPIALRMEGGPHPGLLHTDVDQVGWPPPGFINEVNGKYIKITETTPPDPEEGRIPVLYALYRWVSDKVTEAQPEKVS